MVRHTVSRNQTKELDKKKEFPIYHKSLFSHDSGNSSCCFQQVVQAKMYKKVKTVKIVSKRKSHPTANKAFPIPPVSVTKKVKGQQKLTSFFFFFPWINCQHMLRNFSLLTSMTLWRNGIGFCRDFEKMISCFLHNRKSCNWELQRGGNSLRHSSKTWLLDCSILNEDFFLQRPLKPSWSAVLQSSPLWQPSRCRG